MDLSSMQILTYALMEASEKKIFKIVKEALVYSDHFDKTL